MPYIVVVGGLLFSFFPLREKVAVLLSMFLGFKQL